MDTEGRNVLLLLKIANFCIHMPSHEKEKFSSNKFLKHFLKSLNVSVTQGRVGCSKAGRMGEGQETLILRNQNDAKMNFPFVIVLSRARLTEKTFLRICMIIPH